MLSFTDIVNPGKLLLQLTPWTSWHSVHRALVRCLAQTSIRRTTRAKLCLDYRICSLANTCEQKWQIWPSTSTGTMVFCWSCKQSWSWSNANPPAAGQGLTRSQNSCQIEFSSKNGREISSSLIGLTRGGQLYLSSVAPVRTLFCRWSGTFPNDWSTFKVSNMMIAPSQTIL